MNLVSNRLGGVGHELLGQALEFLELRCERFELLASEGALQFHDIGHRGYRRAERAGSARLKPRGRPNA